MAAGVPPPPINSPSGSYYWLEWYTNLTNFLNGTNIPWANLNFTGSNLTDIQTRHHNDLQLIQGGTTSNRFHMVGVGYIDATGTNKSLPTSWLGVRTATGTYTITHNLGIAVPNLMVGATSNTSATQVDWIDNTTSNNSFVIHTINHAGVATDCAVSFWASTI